MEISSQALGVLCGLAALPAALIAYSTILRGGITGRPVSSCTGVMGLALPLTLVVVGVRMRFYSGGVQLLKLPMYALVGFIACGICDKFMR